MYKKMYIKKPIPPIKNHSNASQNLNSLGLESVAVVSVLDVIL